MPAIKHSDLNQFARSAWFGLNRAAFATRDRAAAIRDMAASTLIAYVAVAIMAAVLVKDLLGPTPAISSVTPTPDKHPAWIEIARPHGAFALEAAILDGLDRHYAVRRHRTGGGRKDILTFGRPEAPGAYMRLSLYRPGAEGLAKPDPLQAAAELAADSGINADLQVTSGKLQTKFGDLPAVNMRVHVRDGWRNCLAVSGAWTDPRLGIVAWWCSPGPEMVALGEFACLLDRTALMSAGGDDQLAAFFARAELRRNYCDSRSSFITPTPRMVTDWIDASRTPGLRGLLSAR